MPRRANALLGILLLLLVAGIGVLGTLQYRWIDRASDAERERMQSNLDFLARRFADELSVELANLFRMYSGATPIKVSPLVEAVYIAQPFDGSLQKLDPATNTMTPVDWPAKLEPMRQALLDARDHGDRRRRPMPLFGAIPALFVVQFAPRGKERIALVVLNREELVNVIWPRLVERYFSRDYDVAVVSGEQVLYRSSPTWPDRVHQADAQAMVMPMPFGRGGGGGGGAPPPRRMEDRDRVPPPHSDGGWRVLVRRSNGGLEAAITSARRRNLALNVTILMILVATVMLLLALLRRADRLRAQQTEFVAAISHELNTPIAALRAAGENLKDGLIADREKLARYGEAIVKESGRLADMVAQVLEFAGMQARSPRRARGPVDIASVVEDAVSQSRALIADLPIEIELHVDRALPHVNGDAASLTRAVQNLVANAIRHAGSGQWVGVRAQWDARGVVVISVEDRGEGIDNRDVAHLFEPFFRGRNSAGVRGAGLGLAIVKQIAEDHGGSVGVEKRRDGGSVFTMRIPAVSE